MNKAGRWSLVVVLGLWTASLRAEEVQWRPARSSTPGALVQTVSAPPAPAFRLGKPVPLTPAPVPLPADDQVRPTAYASPLGPTAVQQLTPIFRAQNPGGVPNVPPPPVPGSGPPSVPPPPNDDYDCGVATTPGPAIPGFIQAITNPCGNRGILQSDHCFDGFISPVTNPFYAMDPRSLTEVRPIFIHQQTPNSNPVFAGGDIDYVGVQTSLALTERLSIKIQKLGWIWSEPHNGTPDLQPHAGFTELHLGPQYTFIRNEKAEGFLPGQSLVTGGLIFEVPIGAHKVAQDTGSLSLVPYLSFAQGFGETPYGTFHFLSTTGVSLSIDKARTDFFYSSYHLDFGIGQKPAWYPFVELNWFYYAQNGNTRTLNFEGQDLFNFGSTNVSGHNDLSIAVGTRYKFSEWFQVGGAVELPLITQRNLMEYRLTFDVIFRY